jgi:hypothetical protein
MQDRNEKHKDSQVLTDGDGLGRSKVMVSDDRDEEQLNDYHEGLERSVEFAGMQPCMDERRGASR